MVAQGHAIFGTNGGELWADRHPKTQAGSSPVLPTVQAGGGSWGWRTRGRYAGSTPPWLLPPVNLLTGGVYQEEMPSPPNSNLNRAGWHLQVRLTVPFIRPGAAEGPGPILVFTRMS